MSTDSPSDISPLPPTGSFNEQIFLMFYRFIIVPLIFVVLGILALFGNRKVRDGLKMRLAKGQDHPWFDLPRETRPIWFHCSSGEFEYAKPVIRLWKEKHPEIPVLVTYYTPSFRRQIQKDKLVDMSCPLPWDLPGPLASFIEHHKPRALLIARTDLWPELLYQAHRKSIPSLLFSATKGVIKGKDRWLLPLRKWMYSKISVVYSVSNEDRINLLDTGAQLVLAKGDTRYDQVIDRLENPKSLNEILLNNDRSQMTLIGGSTWPEDEKVILPAARNLIVQNKLRLIIAPHEPSAEHMTLLKRMCEKMDLGYCLYSEAMEWKPDEVLLIDCVGILAELYQFSDIAAVGGSFNGSVHSVMEPLAAGCPVIVGPDFRNNREALEFKDHQLQCFPTLNMVNTVADHNEFYDLLVKALTNYSHLEKAKNEVISTLRKKMGASQEVVAWTEKQI